MNYYKNIKHFSIETVHNQLDISEFCNKLNRYTEDYKIVLLPDAHIKEKLESPSSAAIAIKDAYSLHLSSPSPNCGMCLLSIPYETDEINKDDLLSDFFQQFIQKVPLVPVENKLTSKEVIDIFNSGVKPVIEKYNINPDFQNHIEMNGNVFNDDFTKDYDIRSTMPDFFIEMSKKYFGVLGGGNHFLEIQSVDEIYDSKVAEVFNIKKNQVVIMFHTGSSAVGSLVGRLYSQRKRNTIKSNIKILPFKMRFHLSDLSLNNLNNRLQYFSPGSFIFMDENELEGIKCLSAYYAAFNFGYANRLYITHAIESIIRNILGTSSATEIVYDLSHNSIFKENIKGDNYWVHRHNSVRALSKTKMNNNNQYSEIGQPVLIPGTNLTSSFLCVAGESVEDSLSTVDHGFGKVIQYYELNKMLTSNKDYKTKLFDYNSNNFKIQNLLSDDGGLKAIDRLANCEIVKPVARLRPFATLKGPKPKFF